MPTILQVIKKFKRYIALIIALPVVALLIFAGILVLQINQLLAATKLVSLSQSVINQELSIQKLIVDEQAGERGYLITGDPKFLQPYSQTQTILENEIDKLRKIVQPNLVQRNHMAVIAALYPQWLSNTQLEIKLKQNNSDPHALEVYFDQGKGRELMDSLRAELSQMQAYSDDRLEDHLKSAQQSADQTTIVVVGLAAIIGAVIAFVTYIQIVRLSNEYGSVLHAEQKNNETLSTTLLSIGDAVMVTDKNGVITQMNMVAEQITGWKNAEVVGKPASDVFRIFNETTRDVVESPVERVIREGVIVGLANHTVLVTRDGLDISIDDSGAPIRDDQGNLIGTILVFRDISERKEMERALDQQYQKEHRIAESLQRSLLSKPSPFAFDNLEVETIYQSAGDEALIGGDFFDIFALESNRIVMVVGDVSGKGLDAAAKTAEIKFALRAFLREDPTPSSAMKRLNEFLCSIDGFSDANITNFLCLSVAVIESDTGYVMIGNAGLDPGFIIRNQSNAVDICDASSSGMSLGIVPGSEYTHSATQMHKGDMLVVATDGITEARDKRGEFLGIRGVAKIVEKCTEAQALAYAGECLMDELTAFVGGTLGDDACAVIIRKK